MLIDWNCSTLHFITTPQALPCLDRPSGNVLSVPHFLSDVPHAFLKNKMKKYQLILKFLKSVIIK